MQTYFPRQSQSQGSSSFARSEDLVHRRRTTGAPAQFDFSRIPIHPPAEGANQAKLAISQPGDQYEQEADRISGQVMGHTCACGGTCSKCRSQQHSVPKVDGLQAKRVDAKSVGPAAVPPAVHEALHSPGQPLDAPTRSLMEPRFGHDFSRVRIHADSAAVGGTKAMAARAFTVGHDIVFGAGEYAPTTVEGRRLLAHELAHVVQQQTFAPPMIARQDAGFWEKASVVFHVGALSGYRAKELATEALQAAQQTGLPGLHNGPADAWRHCYWNCRMTEVIGKDDAEFISQNHEDYEPDEPTAERMMDTWNNEEGRSCKGDCDACCQAKLDAGKLWTLQFVRYDKKRGAIYDGGVSASKPTARTGTPSNEKYEKY